ncbi:MAG: ABC transporter substrate-binding protein [Lachnospiraceae bacterium]|nr:ABC transporter substrate-binding protein [Lachnospiraceae bacterium]
MTTRGRFAAVCVMLATLTVALGACTGNKTGDSSSGQSTASAPAETSAAATTSTSETGTDSTQTETQSPVRDKITIAIPQDLDSIDPHIANAAGTREILFNVFEGLVKPDENGDLVPAIAEQYEISEDATTYTFTLREGVLFHDGTPVTAQDVVYSIERCADESDAATYVSAFSAIASVTAADDRTVEIVLNQPDSEFLAQLTTAVLPESHTDTERTAIGTGPYRLTGWTPQQNVTLTRFDDYWDTAHAAQIKDVVLKIDTDPNTVAMELESGAVDMFCRLTPDQMAQLEGNDKLDIYDGTMNLVVAVYLNNSHEPFRDVRVRQALSMAVNKQEIMDFMFEGKGEPLASSVYPAFAKYYDASLNDVYTNDTEAAKALLAEAGYPDGFTFSVTVPSNYDQYKDMSEILREQFAQIGVTMEIQLIEWNSWLSDVYTNRDYEATIVGVDASTLTAAALLARFSSDAGNNFVNFASADYDAAFAQAQAAIDDDEKTALYKDCARILTEEAASVYLMDMPSYTALNKAFTGYVYYPLYVQDFTKLRAAE